MGALQLLLTGQLVAGPAQVSDSFFPSGSKTIPFVSNPSPKQYSVDTGNVINVNTAAPSFGTIAAIGSGGEVTQASLLYVRTQVPMVLQVTFQNPAGGGNIVSQIPVNGLLIIEPPSNGVILGLAVQGSGQLEYWACGLQ